MLCETAREHLHALSDGEQLKTQWQFALTLRHCLTCHNCRTYQRQLRQITQAARHLPVTLPTGLRERVLSQLPDLAANAPTYAGTHTNSLHQREIAMFKRLTSITGAVLVAAVAVTLTAQTTRPQTPVQAEKSPQQVPQSKYNYAVTDTILRQLMQQKGVSGASASPLGANGWDNENGVSWKVRGQVAVTVFTPQGRAMIQVAGAKLTDAIRRRTPPDDLPPRIPCIEITVNGKMHIEQGYGYHDIKNDAGKLLMRLDVKPLPGVHDDTQDAPDNGQSKNDGEPHANTRSEK